MKTSEERTDRIEAESAAGKIITKAVERIDQPEVGSAADKIITKAVERIDRTGFGDIVVIQSGKSGYGVDSVLLAAFAAGETGAPSITKGARIADLGSGSGIVSFVLHHKLGSARICGYEVQPGAADRAARACKANGFEESVRFVNADIKNIGVAVKQAEGAAAFSLEEESAASGAARIAEPAASADEVMLHIEDSALSGITCSGKPAASADDVRMHITEPAVTGGFDAVVSNPPYFRRTPDEPGASEPDERYIARHETTADITDFTKCAARLLRHGGSLYMVHRPDRLADILCAMRESGIEPKTLQLVTPYAGKAANIALIHGIKGASSELHMLKDISVHKEDGSYTDELLAYYERKTAGDDDAYPGSSPVMGRASKS